MVKRIYNSSIGVSKRFKYIVGLKKDKDESYMNYLTKTINFYEKNKDVI